MPPPKADSKRTTSIVVQPVGGLCNRLRVVASAYILSKKIEADLKLLWIPDKACNCLFGDLFEPPISFEVATIRSPKLFGLIAKRPFSLLSPLLEPALYGAHGRTLTIDNGALAERNFLIEAEEVSDYETVIFKSCFSDFAPSSATPDHYANQASSFLRSIIPSKMVSDQLFDLPSPTIGIHIRRGDNLKSSQKSTTEEFVAKIDDCIADNSAASFLLATDDPDVEQELCIQYPNKILTFPKTSYDRSRKAAIQEALVDLLMLSKCDRILGSFWSSFSETASLFNLVTLDTIGVGPWPGPLPSILARATD